jgi:hypothetical protein
MLGRHGVSILFDPDPLLPNMTVQGPAGLYLRLPVYIALQAFVLALYAYASIRIGKGEMGDLTLERFLRENGVVEGFQIALIGISMLALTGCLRASQPATHRLMLMLLGIPLLREMDALAEQVAVTDAHHVPIAMLTLATLLMAWFTRRRLLAELPGLIRRPGFYFMLFGLLLIAFYAQILGQRDVWRELSLERTSVAKRFVEEGLEMMGYLCILMGITEERLFRSEPGEHPPAATDPEFRPTGKV